MSLESTESNVLIFLVLILFANAVLFHRVTWWSVSGRQFDSIHFLLESSIIDLTMRGRFRGASKYSSHVHHRWSFRCQYFISELFVNLDDLTCLVAAVIILEFACKDA